jgi:DNA-binding transcriptional regulator YdaS (Cro superfamily)
MKTLLDYLNGLSTDEQEALAARCKTTVGYLRQIAYGHRPCKPALAIDLERESTRELICEQLCPDGVDWQYIRAERRRTVRRTRQDRRAPREEPQGE